MVEHHCLYSQKYDVPQGDLDYHVEIGRAKVVAEGTGVTVLAYSSTVGLCLDAAEQLRAKGIEPEIIDLRTVSPPDIDYDTIGRSVKKTGTVVVVEQAPKGLSIGAKIAEQLQRLFFDNLDSPIITCTGLDIPYPVSRKLEEIAVPSVQTVAETIADAFKRRI